MVDEFLKENRLLRAGITVAHTARLLKTADKTSCAFVREWAQASVYPLRSKHQLDLQTLSGTHFGALTMQIQGRMIPSNPSIVFSRADEELSSVTRWCVLLLNDQQLARLVV